MPAQPAKDQIVGAGGGGFACDVGAGPGAGGGLWWIALLRRRSLLAAPRRRWFDAPPRV